MIDDPTLQLLIATAVSTAAFHTLIPDHWLPFVLMGRARGWSGRTTALVSGASAVIHTGTSALLALLALWIGMGVAEALGERLEHASAVLLVVFGLAYAVWAWSKGGHFHPFGHHVHAGEDAAGCHEHAGAPHAGHWTYHADDALIRGEHSRGVLGLAAIVGLNPCVLLLPVVFASSDRGALALTAVIAAYTITTVGLMMGLSVLGVIGLRRIRVPAAARHLEAASGLLIALTGIVVWLLEG